MRGRQSIFTAGDALEPDSILKGQGTVERRGEAWEITFDVGDLRPAKVIRAAR
jgi:hypothetical protein